MARLARRALVVMLALAGDAGAAPAATYAPYVPDAPDAPYALYTVPVAPWTFPDAPARGVASEYLRFLFDAARVPARIGTLPYVRAVLALREGGNAATILIPDAERDRFALRLCEVTSIRSGILYKTRRFPHLEAGHLAGLRIGLQRGTHALDKLAADPAIETHTIDSIGQGLRMLQLDRLDATFLSSPGSDVLLRENGLDPAAYGWLEIQRDPVVVYVSRRSPLARDTAALERLRAVCAGSGKAYMRTLLQTYH
jgi:hypothetical protein